LKRVVTSDLKDLNERVAAALEAEVAHRTRDSAPIEYVAPLCNVDLEGARLNVAPQLVIERMTDREVSVCIAHGLLGHSPLMSAGLFYVRNWCAIRLTSEQPVLVHPGSFEPQAGKHLHLDREAREEVLNVLLALRLFKRGDVSVSGWLKSCPVATAEGSGYETQAGHVLQEGERQILRQGDLAELSELVELARVARKDTSLEVAARRFGFALERHRPEDRLLDLAIAGEALFLQDTKTESAHKFAERGALLWKRHLRPVACFSRS
jgi:hypothetical protein